MWVVHLFVVLHVVVLYCTLLYCAACWCNVEKGVQGLTVGTACFPRFTVGEFGACQMCARERSTFMFCVAINGFKALSFKWSLLLFLAQDVLRIRQVDYWLLQINIHFLLLEAEDPAIKTPEASKCFVWMPICFRYFNALSVWIQPGGLFGAFFLGTSDVVKRQLNLHLGLI